MPLVTKIAVCVLCACTVAESLAAQTSNERVLGRWDLTLQTTDGSAPSWLEVTRSGRDAYVGRFVGIVGSARPVSRIEVRGDSLRFAIPHQWENGDGDLIVQGHADMSGGLAGEMTFPDGSRATWKAVRAPALDRATPAWGSPVALLSANSLAGWKIVGVTAGGTTNQWVVENGVLRSPRSGANLVTTQAFGDFKLHIEFRYPQGGNSGVYLRGRHEVQIEDTRGRPTPVGFSGVYGFIEPTENAAGAPGEWQTFDITLVGRRVTVVANGKTVICDREIPGITGGALDSDEGAPGPLMLQGDHAPIEFRNIVLTPARR